MSKRWFDSFIQVGRRSRSCRFDMFLENFPVFMTVTLRLQICCRKPRNYPYETLCARLCLYQKSKLQTTGLVVQMPRKIKCLSNDELFKKQHYYIPTKRMFSAVWWNHPVCPCVCPCVLLHKILVSVKALVGVLTLSQTTIFRLFQTGRILQA